MESVIREIVDEDEVKEFHSWIVDLTDPDSEFIQEWQEKKFGDIVGLAEAGRTAEPNVGRVVKEAPTVQDNVNGIKFIKNLLEKSVILNILLSFEFGF